jgi:hypothetical protein
MHEVISFFLCHLRIIDKEKERMPNKAKPVFGRRAIIAGGRGEGPIARDWRGFGHLPGIVPG